MTATETITREQTNDAFDALMTAAARWETTKAAERQAATNLREAIRAARAAGFSLAQLAMELGVSRQRVMQLSR